MMEFIDGHDFVQQAPDEATLDQIVQQAYKISQLDLHPKPIYDSWSTLNLSQRFAEVQSYLPDETRGIVEQVVENFERLSLDEDHLPHCFVHGDFTKFNVLQRASDSQIFVIDFSVAGWYPRIHELAVIAADLLEGYEGLNINERCDLLIAKYEKYAMLTDDEKQALPIYAAATAAMKYISALRLKLSGDESEETMLWLKWSRNGLLQLDR
jgi:Ser/Thr protein kinase RdoA (MazF antagonist)